MTTAYEIPLTPATPQQLTVSLAGTQRRLTVRWCEPAAAWVLDVANVDGTVVLSGVPLVTGVDLLGQYGYLNLGGSLVCQTDGDPNAVPTFDNLGTISHLYFLV